MSECDCGWADCTYCERKLVHVDWQMTPEEWEELKKTLLARRSEFVNQLIADGALGEV